MPIVPKANYITFGEGVPTPACTKPVARHFRADNLQYWRQVWTPEMLSCPTVRPTCSHPFAKLERRDMQAISPSVSETRGNAALCPMRCRDEPRWREGGMGSLDNLAAWQPSRRVAAPGIRYTWERFHLATSFSLWVVVLSNLWRNCPWRIRCPLTNFPRIRRIRQCDLVR